VLEEWRFPAPTVHAIRDHYRPRAESSSMGLLLNISAGLVERSGFSLPGEQTYWELTPERQQASGVNEEEAERAILIAQGRFERAREAIA
jgi:hypothetical protein